MFFNIKLLLHLLQLHSSSPKFKDLANPLFSAIFKNKYFGKHLVYSFLSLIFLLTFLGRWIKLQRWDRCKIWDTRERDISLGVLLLTFYEEFEWILFSFVYCRLVFHFWWRSWVNGWGWVRWVEVGVGVEHEGMKMNWQKLFVGIYFFCHQWHFEMSYICFTLITYFEQKKPICIKKHKIGYQIEPF